MRIRPKDRRSPILRERIARQDREAWRRLRPWASPFLGLAVFSLCLLSFALLSQILGWLGLLDGPANWLLVPFAGVGMMAIAPLPMFVPTDGVVDLLASFAMSFLCGYLVHALRPQPRTWLWAALTTAALVGIGGIAHFLWRKLGHDWPDWLAYVRDLA